MDQTQEEYFYGGKEVYIHTKRCLVTMVFTSFKK